MEQIGDIYRSTNRLPFPGRPDIAIPAAMHYLKASDGLVLIDPFEMDPAHGRAVEDLGQPRYVLITNLNHERDAQLYRRRYGAVIGYHRDLAGYFDFEADFLFDDGDELPGGLRAVALPGTFRGETAFWHEGQGGSLVFGDALMNLDLSTYGFAGTFMGTVGWPDGLGTMPRVLMQDEERALESLRGLFDWDFSRLLMTHGTPVQIQARQALRLALNNYQPLVPYFMRRTASTLISRVWERVS